MKQKRILLASDIHLCHFDWYGVKAEDRLQKFIDDLKSEYEKQPFEALLLLGDYSLDYWKWQTKGSYIEKGISYTKRFVDEYLSQLKELPIAIRMIAGNHEQYGEELYHELTGYHREDVYVTGDWLFILMDTYKGGLDPTEHHDGVYTGADMEFINKQLKAYPDKKVVICSHYIEPWRDVEEFKALLRDDRIICLFAGHTHKSEIWHMEEEYGSKKTIFTGQYGEMNSKVLTESMWGFRELLLNDDCIESSYITPANNIKMDGQIIRHSYGKQDYILIKTKEKLC